MKDTDLRAHALQLAMPSPTQSSTTEDVIARAEAYLKFLKGE